MMQAGTSKPPTALIVLALGAVLVVVAYLLPFGSFNVEGFGVSESQTLGMGDVDDGKVYLVLGLVLLVLTGVLWAKRATGSKAVAIAVIVVAALVVVAGIIDIKDIDDLSGLEAETGGVSAEDLEAFGVSLEISAGIGLYLALAGGVIALAGGVLALRQRGDSAPTYVTPATPPPSEPPPAG